MPAPGYLDSPRPLAFAHRGGAYHPEIEGLENTLAAFRHAVALGYTYLETDVHVTSDGVLLAFHDTVLDRVTDRTGSIAASTYAEVQRALIGGSEPVPTLGELFDAFPDARFNIDLKSEGAVEALAAFIEERDAWDRVLVGSFSATADGGVPAPHRPAGRHVGAPARGGRLRPVPQRPAGAVAHPGTPGGPAGPTPTGAGCWWPPPGSYAERTPPASRCTCGRSTTQLR